MKNRIEFRCPTPVDKIPSYASSGDAPELLSMLKDAKSYLTSHEWCPGIAEAYLGFGRGEVIAPFLFRMTRPVEGDKWLWVVVGDLPSAYYVTDCAPNPAEALTAYCELMEDWANAVLRGKDLRDCYPVEAAPTKKHARLLLRRMKFIRKNLVPITHKPWPDRN